MDWGYSKGEVRVDTNESKLSIAQEPVVRAQLVGHRLQIHWYGAWAAWEDLTNSSEVKHLTNRANEALTRASTKGSGKGKKGGGTAGQ